VPALAWAASLALLCFAAGAVLLMKFGRMSCLFRDFGRGPFAVPWPGDLSPDETNYVLISMPLFIFMAALVGAKW